MTNVSRKIYTSDYLVSPVVVSKRCGVVSVSYTGNWKSGTPVGDIGTLFVLDGIYFPDSRYIVMCSPWDDTHIQISIAEDGAVSAYNYGGQITSLRSGRFSVAYVAKN